MARYVSTVAVHSPRKQVSLVLAPWQEAVAARYVEVAPLIQMNIFRLSSWILETTNRSRLATVACIVNQDGFLQHTLDEHPCSEREGWKWRGLALFDKGLSLEEPLNSCFVER